MGCAVIGAEEGSPRCPSQTPSAYGRRLDILVRVQASSSRKGSFSRCNDDVDAFAEDEGSFSRCSDDVDAFAEDEGSFSGCRDCRDDVDG